MTGMLGSNGAIHGAVRAIAKKKPRRTRPTWADLWRTMLRSVSRQREAGFWSSTRASAMSGVGGRGLRPSSALRVSMPIAQPSLIRGSRTA